MNNSQVLGVLKRMVSDHEALFHARGVIEAFMLAQETLINLDNVKALKEKEIAALEDKKQNEIVAAEKGRADHTKEMGELAKERGDLRAEIDALKAEVGQIRGSIDQAVSDKQATLASYEHKIAAEEKVLDGIKVEIEMLKKRFAA